MRYFYGPVPSRRLGFSLGVDLIPKKTCSFDCVYCQLGRGTKLTTRRSFYVNFSEFKSELKEIVKKKPSIDYITISGSGEPTLHKSLDKIITTIKKITNNSYPICVITNSSLLYRKDVRKELKEADLIIPSLDAITTKAFNKINRPHKNIKIKNIIDGLGALRKEFKGSIWLEVMIVKGINDNVKEISKFKEIIKKVKPDKIQLNTPIRLADLNLSLPKKDKLARLERIISQNVEVITNFRTSEIRQSSILSQRTKILAFIKVRPATIKDLEKSLGLSKADIRKKINAFVKRGLVVKKIYNKQIYFFAK